MQHAEIIENEYFSGSYIKKDWGKNNTKKVYRFETMDAKLCHFFLDLSESIVYDVRQSDSKPTEHTHQWLGGKPE